jgi:hypothetical protein
LRRLDVERIGKTSRQAPDARAGDAKHRRIHPGVNPMTNATAVPAVSQPSTYAPIPGVNPMTNAPVTR